MISEDLKYVFIHIPKTGGKTLYTLLPKGVHNAFVFPNIIDDDLGRRKMHLTALEMQQSMGTNFNQYFKFCFVRNPWDRVVSEYEWRKQRPNRIQFSTLLEMLLFIRTGSKETDDRNRHLETQLSMISNSNGKILVDYIARYENYEEEIERIFKKLGAKQPATIPKINKSTRKKDYKSYFNNECRDLVSEIYKEDIETFNYSF